MTTGKTSGSSPTTSPKLGPVVTPADPAALGIGKARVQTPTGATVAERTRAATFVNGASVANLPTLNESAISVVPAEPRARDRSVSADGKTFNPEPVPTTSIRNMYSGLRTGTARMVDRLTKPALADSTQDAVEIKQLVTYLSTVYRKLLEAGEPAHSAQKAIIDAAIAELSKGDPTAKDEATREKDTHRMKRAIEGFTRLDTHAANTNTDTVSRDLARAIQGIDPGSLHRGTLNEQRKARTVKNVLLTPFRAVKQTGRDLKAQFGSEARATMRADGDHANYRNMVNTAMADLIASTRPGRMKSDKELDRLCSLVSLARDVNHRSKEGDAQWRVDIEEYLREQPSEGLLALAARLLETQPGRLHQSEAVTAVMESLRAALLLRPGLEDQRFADALLNGAGPHSWERARTYHIGRVTELLTALLTCRPEDHAIVIDDLDATNYWGSMDSMKGLPAEAVKPLSMQQLEQVERRLQGLEFPPDLVLRAVTARRTELETVAKAEAQATRLSLEAALVEQQLQKGVE